MPHRNIKIVATLGPSSNEKAQISALALAGVNVFRLNMSHGAHEVISKVHSYIREVEHEIDRPIAILGDLQGPKLRCGVFANSKEELSAGDSFTFDRKDEPGSKTRVKLPHPEIFSAIKVGSVLLVNDGLIRMEVKEHGADFAKCTVIVGGTISNRKGVNVPSVILPVSSLSQKDRDDLEFLCELGVDWMALSFVQKEEDVLEAKSLIKGRAKLISKIEKPSAVEAFESILEVSDGIMIARGDLGVELPAQQLPAIQKRLIRQCRSFGKPVIVATQMLESMINSPVPTRAEVSDVASAIYDGADAVMLSAESAAGDYPVEAVQLMVDIAHDVEADENYRSFIQAGLIAGEKKAQDPITTAASQIAESGDIQAICCFTESGFTAQCASRERPCVPILALTPNQKVARQLCLFWGTTCLVTQPVSRFKGAVNEAIAGVKKAGLAVDTDRVGVTAGVPFNKKGTTNILRLAYVDGSDVFPSEAEVL
jgi:pyruvate kinase